MQGVIVQSAAGRRIELNETAGAVFLLAARGHTPEHIASAIEQATGEPAARCLDHVRETMRELLRRGVLCIVG